MAYFCFFIAALQIIRSLVAYKNSSLLSHSFCRSASWRGVTAFSTQILTRLKQGASSICGSHLELGVLARCWQKPFPYGCRTEVPVFLLVTGQEPLSAPGGSLVVPIALPACFSSGVSHLLDWHISPFLPALSSLNVFKVQASFHCCPVSYTAPGLGS